MKMQLHDPQHPAPRPPHSPYRVAPWFETDEDGQHRIGGVVVTEEARVALIGRLAGCGKGPKAQ